MFETPGLSLPAYVPTFHSTTLNFLLVGTQSSTLLDSRCLNQLQTTQSHAISGKNVWGNGMVNSIVLSTVEMDII